MFSYKHIKMGCCTSAKTSSASFLYCKKLQDAIERSNLKTLVEIQKLFPPEPGKPNMIDEPFITIHDLNMSPLAYALWIGKVVVFQFLHKKMGASLEAMETLFVDQGKTAIEVICSNGSLEILQYYLPYYNKSLKPVASVLGDISISVDFQRSTLVETKLKQTYTPAHIACEHGHVNIIHFLHATYKDKPAVPHTLDIDFQDESSGENCALIACRKGDYKMVKFLYEVCSANFRALNKRHENAIVVTAAASKRRPTHDFYNLFVYLAEVVKLDYTYMHEEVMLLLEDRNIIKYFENKLQKKGIASQKNNVERKYEITRPNIPVSKEEMMIEELGDNFQLRKCLEETEDNTESVLSSIHEDYRPVTPFMSTLTLDGK